MCQLRPSLRIQSLCSRQAPANRAACLICATTVPSPFCPHKHATAAPQNRGECHLICEGHLERSSSESGPGVPGPTFMSYFGVRGRFRLNSASTVAKLDPLQLFNAAPIGKSRLALYPALTREWRRLPAPFQPSGVDPHWLSENNESRRRRRPDPSFEHAGRRTRSPVFRSARPRA